MTREDDLYELASRVCDLMRDNGYMTGPCALGLQERTARNGNTFYDCVFSISRYADGAVSIFGPRSFYANWIQGRYRGNERFRSYDEIEEWIVNNGWAR